MKIDRYSTTVHVTGTFEDTDEQHIVTTWVGGQALLVSEFDMRFTAADDGWGVRWVKVGGYKLKKDGAPGRVWASREFLLGDPDTPQWVRKLVVDVHPDRPAPRPPALDGSHHAQEK
ncbi:hypothetical protein [Streptomyces albidoflavus]|uniref:hypothetical protein n=1 Tax=Streptomyces albidoflavus TaxID=1886 RepID=UPI0033E26AE6